MITYDTETHLIWRPVVAPKPVCHQWCDRRPEHDLDGRIEKFSSERAAELLTSGEVIYGHNLAYDALVLMAADPELIELVFKAYDEERMRCTLVDQKLIDNARGELKFRKTRGHAMDEVGRRYGVQVDKEDPWRLRYGKLEHIALEDWPADAREYAIRDVTKLWTIVEGQQAIDRAWEAEYGSPILHQGPARARADLALALARAWGARTSASQCNKLEQAVEREIERMKEVLVKHGLVRKNGSKDTKAAKARVEARFRELGKDIPKVDEDDEDSNTSTERDTMILSGDEILIMYSEYTTANNLMNRVQDLKKGIHLPLQPRYDSFLETGRTSSSKGYKKGKDQEPGQILGIQIQNFPRALSENAKQALLDLGFAKVVGTDKKGRPQIVTSVGARECLIPRDGNVFVLADYEAAELHTLAQVHTDMFGQSSLAKILNGGDDPHLWVGIDTYSGGEYTYEKALKKRKDEMPFKGWRQAAKPITFGRPGGMGAAKIVVTARKSYEVIMTLEEAERTIRVYETIVPELPEQFRLVSACLEGEKGHKRGLVRHLRTGMWRGKATFCQMNNTYFQHLAAAGALDALFQVAMECYCDQRSALYGFRIVAFVHDEIVLEGPRDRAHDAAMRLQHVMEREMDKYTQDCPTPAEPIVTEVWSKSAKQMKDADGHLVPWRAG